MLIIYVLYRLCQHLFPSSNIDYRGKYVLVSGCDTGFGHALTIELDITRQEDIDAAYEIVQKKTNTLHALVNNAGVAMTKTFLPLLTAKRDSRVVNITSALGMASVPTSSTYCASKYALESFSDCLRREMASWGLRVCIIELSTDIQDRWGEDFLNDRITK